MQAKRKKKKSAVLLSENILQISLSMYLLSTTRVLVGCTNTEHCNSN